MPGPGEKKTSDKGRGSAVKRNADKQRRRRESAAAGKHEGEGERRAEKEGNREREGSDQAGKEEARSEPQRSQTAGRQTGRGRQGRMCVRKDAHTWRAAGRHKRGRARDLCSRFPDMGLEPMTSRLRVCHSAN